MWECLNPLVKSIDMLEKLNILLMILDLFVYTLSIVYYKKFLFDGTFILRWSIEHGGGLCWVQSQDKYSHSYREL